MYPGEFDISEWTKEKQIETIKTPMRKYLSWAYYSGLIPYWSMIDSNLSDSDLRGSDLSGSNLSDSVFYYSRFTMFPEGFDPKERGGLLVE